MRYKLFGKSGLRVSELCLGTMTFGEVWKDWNLAITPEEGQKIFEAFAEAGGTFIDTANNYNQGQSETWVGKLVKSDRDHFVLATKYTLSMREGDPNFSGNHRKNMMRSVEESLKRLNTEYVDILWLHAWDFMTPVEEVMRGLNDLVRSGKVLYIGISDAPAWIVSQANTLAQGYGWNPFVGLQVEYSLAQRDVERELMPMARAFDLAVMAWSPLAGGLLTGKYSQTKPSEGAGRLGEASAIGEKRLHLANSVGQIAEQIGRPASQVALNWLRQQRGVVIPIIGSRKVSQIQENLGCLDWQLTPEQIDKLSETTHIELGFPHDFLAGDMIRQIIYGGTYSAIDNHHQ